MIPIILSPSQQTNNRCVMGDTEADHCREIANKAYNILKKDNRFSPHVIKFIGGRDTYYLPIVCEQSNYLCGDAPIKIHIAIHTDAFDTKSSGSSAFFMEGGLGAKLGISIFNELKLISGKGRQCSPDTKLYELVHTNASATLIELDFHDNMYAAQKIHSCMDQYAMAIVRGIYKALDIEIPIKKVDEAPQWKLDGAKYLKDCGYTNDLHDALKTVDIGLLGTILKNYDDKKKTP